MNAKGKILVVDDDRLVLATLTHGLSQAGYEIIDADNGDDAILLARQHKPDLALLDIRMEGKSGFDVAEYLRDHCQMPFMFLSAFTDDATVTQVRALGAVDYLVKPLDVRQIVPAVAAAFLKIGDRPAVARPAEPVGADVLTQAVPIAVGVLMHRYSIGRKVALERLQRQALAEGRSVQEQSERLLQAVELLSS